MTISNLKSFYVLAASLSAITSAHLQASYPPSLSTTYPDVSICWTNMIFSISTTKYQSPKIDTYTVSYTSTVITQVEETSTETMWVTGTSTSSTVITTSYPTVVTYTTSSPEETCVTTEVPVTSTITSESLTYSTCWSYVTSTTEVETTTISCWWAN